MRHRQPFTITENRFGSSARSLQKDNGKEIPIMVIMVPEALYNEAQATTSHGEVAETTGLAPKSLFKRPLLVTSLQPGKLSVRHPTYQTDSEEEVGEDLEEFEEAQEPWPNIDSLQTMVKMVPEALYKICKPQTPDTELLHGLCISVSRRLKDQYTVSEVRPQRGNRHEAQATGLLT